MDLINNDVILQILTHLIHTCDIITARLVCKTWRDIIDQHLLKYSSIPRFIVKRRFDTVTDFNELRWITEKFDLKENDINLKLYGDTNAMNNAVLQMAIDDKNFDILNWFLTTFSFSKICVKPQAPYDLLNILHYSVSGGHTFTAAAAAGCNMYVLQCLAERLDIVSLDNKTMKIDTIFKAVTASSSTDTLQWLFRYFCISKDNFDPYGEIALMNAAENGSMQLINWICNYFNITTKEQFASKCALFFMRFVFYACRGGHIAIMEWILRMYSIETCCNLDESHIEAMLRITSKCGHLHFIEWIYNSRENFPYYEDYLELIYKRAVRYSHVHILSWLKDNFEEGFDKLCLRLAEAVQCNSLHIFDWLLRYRTVSIFSNNREEMYEAFSCAAATGNLVAMRWLYNEGKKDKYFNVYEILDTSFMNAAKCGNVYVLSWLNETFDINIYTAVKAFLGGVVPCKLRCMRWIHKTFHIRKSYIYDTAEFERLLCENKSLKVIKWIVPALDINLYEIRDVGAIDVYIDEDCLDILVWMVKYFSLTIDDIGYCCSNEFLITVIQHSNYFPEVLDWLLATFPFTKRDILHPTNCTCDPEHMMVCPFSFAIKFSRNEALKKLTNAFSITSEDLKSHVNSIRFVIRDLMKKNDKASSVFEMANWFQRTFGISLEEGQKRRRLW